MPVIIVSPNGRLCPGLFFSKGPSALISPDASAQQRGLYAIFLPIQIWRWTDIGLDEFQDFTLPFRRHLTTYLDFRPFEDYPEMACRLLKLSIADLSQSNLLESSSAFFDNLLFSSLSCK